MQRKFGVDRKGRHRSADSGDSRGVDAVDQLDEGLEKHAAASMDGGADSKGNGTQSLTSASRAALNQTSAVRRVCIEHKAGFIIQFWLTLGGTSIAGPKSPKFSAGFTKCLDARDVPGMADGSLVMAFFSDGWNQQPQTLFPAFLYNTNGQTATFTCSGVVDWWHCPVKGR